MKNQENDFIFVHSSDTGELCTAYRDRKESEKQIIMVMMLYSY